MFGGSGRAGLASDRMSPSTLGVWAIVLAAGVFAVLSILLQARRYPGALSGRERTVRWVIVTAWVAAAVITPVFAHPGPQPVLTAVIAAVVVACLAVGLVDFLD